MWLFIRGLCAFHKLLNLSELRDPHRAPTVSPPCPLPTPTLRGALQRAWFSVDGTQEVLDKFRDSWAKPALNLPQLPDRKSIRLNSSHLGISYAVFCLKK